MPDVGLLLRNTDRLQQVEDYVRGCASAKLWPHSTSCILCQRFFYFYQILNAFNKLNGMSEDVLLLPNTDRLQQVDVYVRGGTTSTKYWPHSTGWRLCQRLYYFYQTLTALNKLKIMSDVVLLLPNTDCLKQFDDYLRGSTWQLKKVKTIYRFHKLVFDWENEALNVSTEPLQTVGCASWLNKCCWYWGVNPCQSL